MSDQPEFEELEHIPWSALAVKPPASKTTLVYVVLGVVAAIGLGLLAARWLLPGDGQSTVTLPPVAVPDQAATAHQVAVADIANPVPAVATTTAATGESPVSTAVGLYSEADLMAISYEAESSVAVFHAESFVLDYFTIDGDEEVAAHNADLIQGALPPTAPTVSSYVEWARAYAVASPHPGRYRVEVAYRLLVGVDGRFAREPVAAVALELSVDVDGTTKLVYLPELIEAPVLLGLDRQEYLSDYPDALVAQAVERLAQFGSADILGIYPVEGGWHVVANVEGAPGVTRPLMVMLDD